MDAPKDQSDGRTPHPLSRPGSIWFVNWVEPNAALSIGPHSPLASGLCRLQSGLRLKFESVQLRATHGFVKPSAPNKHRPVVDSPLPNGIRNAGFAPYPRLLTLAPCRYFPRFTLSEVLPLPNT